jgi:hypothetical protein
VLPMRRLVLVAIVLLLAPVAAHAQQRGYQARLNVKGSLWYPGGGLFGFGGGQGAPQLGPWYLYWPLEAHFQTPAPPAYPYWPQGGAAQAAAAGNYAVPAPYGYGPPVPGGFVPGAVPVVPRPMLPPQPVPSSYAPPGPANFHAPQITQAGYNVPYYWYGR